METPKEFLIEWLKSYTGLNTQSIYDLAKEVDNRYTKALQFQQTGVNGSFCSNCRWLNSCAIRIDYNVDTCEEHEF